ncbi:MAG: hypothetical protein DRQ55_18010 [Planctomycetota bacterium]|nr:MAG: hypothetical protein DRQ55_18010 [Planctomycetota bacterium]
MNLLKNLFSTSAETCEHVPAQLATPSGNSCEECGSTFSLRMCADCGHVGCCDSQAGDARKHYLESGHEVMASMPVGSGFTWCYTDDRYAG